MDQLLPPTAEQVVDIILNRREVYGLDIDSRIREAADNLTARAFFEVLARIDMNAPDIGFPTESGHFDNPKGILSYQPSGCEERATLGSPSTNIFFRGAKHLRITLSSPDALQTFMESLHANPFLLRVENSTDEEFERAISPPS